METHEKGATRVMICAGEISGDIYGAALVREMRAAAHGPLEFFGLGGDLMAEEGVDLLEHASKTGVIGFTEVVKRARFFAGLYKRLVRAMDERRPSMLLTVDYPGMNLRLARAAKKRGVTCVHYVCPQVWAWRRGRIPEIAETLDFLVALFPFEPALFDGTGLRVGFYGHPLVDSVSKSLSEPHGALPWGAGRRIAVFAGSRANEVRRILPDVLAGAALAERKLGKCTFLLPAPDESRAADVRAVIAAAAEKPDDVRVVVGSSRIVLSEAEAAVVKSGTSTLEAALADCPFFIPYRLSGLTYRILKPLVKGVRFIGLVNIIPDREVCRELVQGGLTPQAVCDELVRIVADPAARAEQKKGLAEVRAALGEPGATARAARDIVALL